MTKFTFIVIAHVPQGVQMSEVADHLADASRTAARNYHPSDPLCALADIEVYGSVASSDLPPSSEEIVHGCSERSAAIRRTF